MSELSTNNIELRNRQRYRYIKLVADTMGLTLRDLHREFNAAESKKPDGKPVACQSFYRVAAGKGDSARIRRFISTRLRHNHEEIWS